MQFGSVEVCLQPKGESDAGGDGDRRDCNARSIVRSPDSGWQNAVSAIRVQAGTRDFFIDDNYGGNTMRLTPGTCPTLTPDWEKKISSFMCVAPADLIEDQVKP
jgi:hypothetical protein